MFGRITGLEISLYFKLGKTKPKTVRDYINGKFPMFIEYCSINGIHSFADVTLEDYLNFKRQAYQGQPFITMHKLRSVF